MTRQSIIIALIAGATTVVLLAAGLTSRTLALPLMILAPLPIAIAGLGWGSSMGFVATFFAFIGATYFSSLMGGLLFAGILGLPIAYLVHLVGLSRQDDPNQPMEWFPESTILWRAISIGGAVIGLAFVFSGFNVDDTIKRGLEVFADSLKQLDDTNRKTMEEAIAYQIRLTPYTLPMAWLLTIWLNLWLGIRVTKTSQLFHRPSFRLENAQLPFAAILVLAAGIILGGISSPLSLLGASFAGIILMAIIMLGFNTVHIITSRVSMRIMLLTMLYMTTIFFAFPILLVLGIGLADLFFKIRQRYRLTNPI